MPSAGSLLKNLNLSRETLLKRIGLFQQDTVYSYIVDTVEYREGRMYQAGSGPNFQGDLITLCSCKHMMRTYLDTEFWRGVWVAGFTGSSDSSRNKLFYLMMVSQAFESHREFWLSDSIPEETKNAKAAHIDRFGDVYKPESMSGDPYSHRRYFEPCKNHVHCEPGDWRKDISHPKQHGRRPALLVGHLEYSFLWSKTLITSPFKLYRGQKKTSLSDLFS